MFWYIGAVLMGFAIGFLVFRGPEPESDKTDSGKSEEPRYRIGIHDCRNCKHNVIIEDGGWIKCKVNRNTLVALPRHCAQYKKI